MWRHDQPLLEDHFLAHHRQGWLHGGPDNKFDPRLNVFTVEEYESNDKTAKKWIKIGAAFPHKEGIGFSIELRAFPMMVAW